MMKRLNLKKLTQNEQVMVWGQIVLGCLIGGAAYPMFLTPGNIAPGGLTGVSMILNYLLHVPVGTTALILNIPLFILGYRSMGRVFVIRSFVATVLFSLAIDLLKIPPMTTEPILGAIFGGATMGVGLGLILRGGATTGGTDMIAKMVHQKLPFVSTGMFLMLIDFVVVIFAAVCIGTTEALFALVCIFVNGRVIDMVMLGLSKNKACFVMSDKWEEISHLVLTDMDRGATQLLARGAYSGKERPVLLCVLPPQEVARFKEIVRKEDDRAFMFITEAHEALGEGFEKLSVQD